MYFRRIQLLGNIATETEVLFPHFSRNAPLTKHPALSLEDSRIGSIVAFQQPREGGNESQPILNMRDPMPQKVTSNF